MGDSLTDAIEALETSLSVAGEILSEEEARPVRQLIDSIRVRRGFLGKTLVIAIAGGTGSGKSSLLNAIAGEKIAETGRRRPTTDRPLAWMPREPTKELEALLDELGVVDRAGNAALPHVAVIDLPDFDSFEVSHRKLVEELIPRVDAVIWVADPEKYNDRVLHREFIEVFRRYDDLFTFVLNQVDLVEPEVAVQIAADWENLLRADGVDVHQIIATAADPDQGPMVGIEDVKAELSARLDAKRAVVTKISSDLIGAADHLALATGSSRRSAPAFDSRWSRARAATAGALTAGGVDPRRRIDKAVAALYRFVGELAVDLGPPHGGQVRSDFPRALIREICLAAPAITAPRPRARWARLWLIQAVLALAAIAGALLAVTATALWWVAVGGSLIGIGIAELMSRRAARLSEERDKAMAEAHRDIELYLDDNIGLPLRAVARSRAEIGASFVALGLEAAKLRAD